jgi:hypothetical protein
VACSLPPPLNRTPCDHVQRGAAIESPADYAAITSTAPFLKQLSLRLPAGVTALPQEMAGMLSGCSKLEDLAMRSSKKYASLVDITALAAGTQLLSLQLPCCFHLTNVAPLASLVNLQSLDISGCRSVSDLAPLTAMVNLKRTST